MKGNPEVLECLQQALTDELKAIHQYYLHAKIYEERGLSKLYEHQFGEAKDEMHHADELIARILFLEGVPKMGAGDPGKVSSKTEQMLKNDLELEYAGIKTYKRGLAAAIKHGDPGSEALIRKLLSNEEEHVDWLETQLNLIKELGLTKYEQTKV